MCGGIAAGAAGQSPKKFDPFGPGDYDPSKGAPVRSTGGGRFQSIADERYKKQGAIYEDYQRQQAQAQMDRLAAERTAAVVQQQQQLQEAQRQQAELAAAQGKEAADLQAQQAARVAGIQNAGSAVTQSLQILGKQQTKQGPTASVAKKPGTQVAGGRTAARSLQIGSTSSTPGAGTNLSV